MWFRLSVSISLFHLAVGATAGFAEEWKPVRPEGLRFLDFAQTAKGLFAGTASEGIHRSMDGGRSWTQVASCYSGSFHSVPALHASAGLLVASFEGGGVCVSLDDGDTWMTANHGLPQQPFLYAFARLGDTLFAGGTGVYGEAPLFKTPVNDFRWGRADSGLPSGVRTVQRLVATRDGMLVAGISNTRLPSAGTVFLSRDRGASWHATRVPFPYAVYHMIHIADALVIATEHGIFRSEDFGDRWSSPSGEPPREEFYSLVSFGKELYAGSGHGRLYSSRDYGATWVPEDLDLPGSNLSIEALWLGQDILLASLGPEVGGWYKDRHMVGVGPLRPKPGLQTRGSSFNALGRIGAPSISHQFSMPRWPRP